MYIRGAWTIDVKSVILDDDCRRLVFGEINPDQGFVVAALDVNAQQVEFMRYIMLSKDCVKRVCQDFFLSGDCAGLFN